MEKTLFECPETIRFFLRSCKLTAYLCIAFLTFGCNSTDRFHIVVPSLNTRIEINSSLTYSETLVTNITSAHLVKINNNLQTTKEVLSKIEQVDKFTFMLHLNPNYRSHKGERIFSKDLIFTFKHYISSYPDIMRVFSTIKGSASCSKYACNNLSIKEISDDTVQIKLKEENQNFVHDLAVPSFVILKKDKPVYERVGECLLPYQTGKAIVTSCDHNQIILEAKKVKIKLTKEANSEAFRFTNTTASTPHQASLASLFFIANPDRSKSLYDFTRGLIKSKNALAEFINIQPTKSLTPSWLGIPDFELKAPRSKKINWDDFSARIVIAKSVPSYTKIISFLRNKYPKANFSFKVVESQDYFSELKKADAGLLWLTPGYFDFYDLISVFDCSPKRACWFDYKDAVLQKRIDKLRLPVNRRTNKQLVESIENHLQQKGYIAPIGLVHWWLQKGDKKIPTHPAGLFQVNLLEVLNV